MKVKNGVLLVIYSKTYVCLFISLFDDLLCNVDLLKIIYTILFFFAFFIFRIIPKCYNLLLILDFYLFL
jgi:hypothetical protein